MWCSICNTHLSVCMCVDLKERLDDIVQSGFVWIAPDVLKAYYEQAERNKEDVILADEYIN